MTRTTEVVAKAAVTLERAVVVVVVMMEDVVKVAVTGPWFIGIVGMADNMHHQQSCRGASMGWKRHEGTFGLMPVIVSKHLFLTCGPGH